MSKIFWMAISIAACESSLLAFSKPHNDASDPLMRASWVLGFTENNAPVAGEPGKDPA